MTHQQPDREYHRAHHQTGLYEIGPDNCLDFTNSRVERSKECDEQNTPEIDPDINCDARKEVLPNDLNDYAPKVKTHANSQYPRKKKNPACQILGPRAKPDLKEFIDALDTVAIVGANEGKRDEDPRNDGADR